MTAKEFFDKKAIKYQYDDYEHYCDCRDYLLFASETTMWADEYATLREQEAFWAGQNSVIDSINLQQNRQTFEDWKEATK